MKVLFDDHDDFKLPSRKKKKGRKSNLERKSSKVGAPPSAGRDAGMKYQEP
jgi:hypothetical protein